MRRGQGQVLGRGGADPGQRRNLDRLPREAVEAGRRRRVAARRPRHRDGRRRGQAEAGRGRHRQARRWGGGGRLRRGRRHPAEGPGGDAERGQPIQPERIRRAHQVEQHARPRRQDRAIRPLPRRRAVEEPGGRHAEQHRHRRQPRGRQRVLPRFVFVRLLGGDAERGGELGQRQAALHPRLPQAAAGMQVGRQQPGHGAPAGPRHAAAGPRRGVGLHHCHSSHCPCPAARREATSSMVIWPEATWLRQEPSQAPSRAT